MQYIWISVRYHLHTLFWYSTHIHDDVLLLSSINILLSRGYTGSLHFPVNLNIIFSKFVTPFKFVIVPCIFWILESPSSHLTVQYWNKGDACIQGCNARKVNCCCVYSAYVFKTSSFWAEFKNKSRCISVRLVSEEVKSIKFW